MVMGFLNTHMIAPGSLPPRRTGLKLSAALAAAAVIAAGLASNSPSSAQSQDNPEGQYSREALQQALKARDSYELYGIHFDVDRATIQPGGEQLLDDVATTLKNFPDWRLRVVGHTDATGGADANLALSLDRANAIKAALVERGVNAERLQVAGAGQQRPIADDRTDEGRAKNRRVELVRFTDSAEARKILKTMSDYLAAQNDISFSYDASLEVVTTAGQKLGLATSGAVTLKRPDKLRSNRSGGLINVEAVFDGKTLTLLGKNVNKYTQIDVPGTVDHLVNELSDKFQLPLPAADLLTSDPYTELMQDVYDSKDLGSGFVNGVECDSLAFRKDDVDFQIWVAQGDEPYPCRLVATSKLVATEPQYSIQVRDWKTGDEVGQESFTFTNASDAQLLDVKDLKSKLGELPENFVMGDAQ